MYLGYPAKFGALFYAVACPVSCLLCYYQDEMDFSLLYIQYVLFPRSSTDIQENQVPWQSVHVSLVVFTDCKKWGSAERFVRQHSLSVEPSLFARVVWRKRWEISIGFYNLKAFWISIDGLVVMRSPRTSEEELITSEPRLFIMKIWTERFVLSWGKTERILSRDAIRTYH